VNDLPYDIRITTDPARAWDLLYDLATNEELYAAVNNRETAADALKDYGVELADDAIPPEPSLPPMDEIREGLEELRPKMRLGQIEPHVGFRPPICPRPPTHSATFGYVFGVLAGRAQPPEE
jgi:hypothetical protein